MKKLLILVDKIGVKKEYFAHFIAQNLPKDSQVVLARFSDVIIENKEGKVEVYLDGNKIFLKDFNLVYFRRAGSNFLSMAGTLGIFLNHLGIPFFDSTFENIGPAGDKLTSYIRLCLAGLPCIPFYFCWHSKIEEKKKEIIKKFGLPLVAKSLSLQRGKGVFLIKKEEDIDLLIKNYPENEFFFQKYFKGKDEYRILVLKDTIGSFEKKIKSKTEFRANVALGATEEYIDLDKITPEMKEIAIKGAQALKIEIAGVDVLVDEHDQMWLLEINRGPGLTYDPQISPELKNLASFFKRELGKTNE